MKQTITGLQTTDSASLTAGLHEPVDVSANDMKFSQCVKVTNCVTDLHEHVRKNFIAQYMLSLLTNSRQTMQVGGLGSAQTTHP